MSVMFWQDHMTGSAYLQKGGIKVKLDPMVADAFAELYASTSLLEVERLSRLLDEERERRERLEGENARLRERVAELDELLPENGRWFSFETVDAYVVENRKLRKVARELRANLCNRETLLELLGMPSTAETKAAMEDLFNRCDELGVD